jgi:ATP-dependent DNA helicase RecG
MSSEGQNVDCKSLKLVTGKTANWEELAKDCVAFAKAQGGRLLLGIEDGETEPHSGQRIPMELAEKVRKRISELTVNVTATAAIQTTASGGKYLEILVNRSHAPASTTDGRFYLRVADESKPLVGEEIQRLMNERSAQPWETLTTLQVKRGQVDSSKLAAFAKGIRTSDRVKASIKEKNDSELLDHYLV